MKLKVRLSTKEETSVETTDTQNTLFDACQKFRRLIVQKERQIRATTLLMKYAVTFASICERKNVLIVTQQLNQSLLIFRKLCLMVEDASFTGEKFSVEKINVVDSIEFTNGSHIFVIHASQWNEWLTAQRGREGMNIDCVIADEFNWINKNVLLESMNESKQFIAVSSKPLRPPTQYNLFSELTWRVLDNVNCEFSAIEKMRMFGVK